MLTPLSDKLSGDRSFSDNCLIPALHFDSSMRVVKLCPGGGGGGEGVAFPWTLLRCAEKVTTAYLNHFVGNKTNRKMEKNRGSDLGLGFGCEVRVLLPNLETNESTCR